MALFTILTSLSLWLWYLLCSFSLMASLFSMLAICLISLPSCTCRSRWYFRYSCLFNSSREVSSGSMIWSYLLYLSSTNSVYRSSFSNGMITCGTKVLLLEESLEYSNLFEMFIFILLYGKHYYHFCCFELLWLTFLKEQRNQGILFSCEINYEILHRSSFIL